MNFKAIAENMLSAITAIGSIIFTNEQNMYIVKSDGSKMKLTDVIFVNDITDVNLVTVSDKIYIDRTNWKAYIRDSANSKNVCITVSVNSSTFDIAASAEYTFTCASTSNIIFQIFKVVTLPDTSTYDEGIIYGSYDDTSSVGVKILNSTSITIKNKTADSLKLKMNIVS